MAQQADWAFGSTMSLKQAETLKHIDTSMVEGHEYVKASTKAIRSALKTSDEVAEEMKRWLRTGITPDGTRMMTEEAWQWHLDYYHGTTNNDQDHDCLPEGAGVDYHYWTCPYKSHIGDMNFVMMYPCINFPDGTHMPADRLRQKTKKMKNIELLARKRAEVERRNQEKEVQELERALAAAHRGHPLRKDGFYTKYFWKPLFKPATRADTTTGDRIVTGDSDVSAEAPPQVVEEARQLGGSY